MPKLSYLLPLLLLLLIGCSSNVTGEDLIGGNWVATAGYKDGKPVGEPYCRDIFTGGLEFKGEGIVHGKEFDEEYEYIIEEWEGKTRIVFIRQGKFHHNYFIDKISNDEIGLTGSGEHFENQSCYLERK